ncbi:MAG: AmmeMemoRadiSam system protein B [Candidatus Omnitrophica bacterium 4484_70.2]|nr:MAG: AmmeMemoRadiSam system protein B [Candidatus Omnitrophica bacterium 4484_70.2]
MPSVAGYFYPKEASHLKEMVDGFLKDASIPSISGKIIGLLAPHAGYVYSGKVAGYSYKAIEGKKFDTVIIMGPSHHFYFEGISVFKEGFFRTPLGDVEIDKTSSEFILDRIPHASFNRKVFDPEHCIEVQLPFLQRVLKNFKIVPIVFGRVNIQQLKKLASVLDELSKDKKTLVVVSSDLSHYHSYTQAKNIDARTIELIKNLEPYKFYTKSLSKEIEACGFEAITCLLFYAQYKKAKPYFLKYLNSGDTSFNKSRVVGYCAFVFVEE